MNNNYFIYQNENLIGETQEKYYQVKQLISGLEYTFQIGLQRQSEIVKSDPLKVKMPVNYYMLALPYTIENPQIAYYEDAIGTEKMGLGTSSNFGGTKSVLLTIRNNGMYFEIPEEYGNSTGKIIEQNKNHFLFITENKIIEITKGEN